MLKWAYPPIDRFIKYIEEEDKILHLSMQGITQISRMVPLVEALVGLEKAGDEVELPETQRNKVEDARKRAAFAQGEIDKGFPVLISHTIISYWAALETLISDLAIAYLMNDEKILEKECFSKIKISIAEYERLEKEDRMAYILSELYRSLGTDLKMGVGRFEGVLDLISLPGKVDDKVRKDIFEMSQVRNLIVHRVGIVDRRFKEACPWIGTGIGERYVVSFSDYDRYRNSVVKYVAEVIDRVRIYFGHGPYKTETN